MDKVECAGRILARAFGYGCAWTASFGRGADPWRPDSSGVPEELRLEELAEPDAASAVTDSLRVYRESETVERAGDSASVLIGRRNAPERTLRPEQRRTRARLTEAECERLWAWEAAHPLNKGQKANPRRPREHDHWKRDRSAVGVSIVRPKHRMDQDALAALAGLPKPFQALLLLYATGDRQHWLVLRPFARACLPTIADDDLAEGAVRLLLNPAKAQRAKERGMRREDWDARSRPSLRLFEGWIERAADAYLSRLRNGQTVEHEAWNVADCLLFATVRGPPPAFPKP